MTELVQQQNTANIRHHYLKCDKNNLPLGVLRTKARRADVDDPMKAVVAVGATKTRRADWNFIVWIYRVFDVGCCCGK
jgi:hypothetical protein